MDIDINEKKRSERKFAFPTQTETCTFDMCFHTSNWCTCKYLILGADSSPYEENNGTEAIPGNFGKKESVAGIGRSTETHVLRSPI